MSFKDVPRWLLLGSIFLIISLGLELIDYAMAAILCPKEVAGLICMLPLRILEILVPFGLAYYESSIIRIAGTAIFYFFIGALIGVIISKIKSKK